MLEFQKKKRIKSMIYSKIVLALILVVLFFFAKATADFYKKAHESKLRKERAESELIELNKRKNELQTEISRMESPVGIEQELRARFDLVKEGEETILIVDGKADASSSENETDKKGGFWGRLMFWRD